VKESEKELELKGILPLLACGDNINPLGKNTNKGINK
jgi:hypothetical protein